LILNTNIKKAQRHKEFINVYAKSSPSSFTYQPILSLFLLKSKFTLKYLCCLGYTTYSGRFIDESASWVAQYRNEKNDKWRFFNGSGVMPERLKLVNCYGGMLGELVFDTVEGVLVIKVLVDEFVGHEFRVLPRKSPLLSAYEIIRVIEQKRKSGADEQDVKDEKGEQDEQGEKDHNETQEIGSITFRPIPTSKSKSRKFIQKYDLLICHELESEMKVLLIAGAVFLDGHVNCP